MNTSMNVYTSHAFNVQTKMLVSFMCLHSYCIYIYNMCIHALRLDTSVLYIYIYVCIYIYIYITDSLIYQRYI